MINKREATWVTTTTVLAVGTGTGMALHYNSLETEEEKDNASFKLAKGNMPNFTVLALGDGFYDSYLDSFSDSKIGYKYGSFLTDTYGTHGVFNDVNDNEKWWKWSFNFLQKDLERGVVLTGEFSKVESAYSSEYSSRDEGSEKSLNQICKKEYNKRVTETIDNRSLWRYCSSLGKEPVTVAQELINPYPEDSLGRTNNNLVSVDDEWNDIFWKLRSEEFYGFKRPRGNGTGYGLQSTKDPKFYELYKNKSSPNLSGFKEACREIYKLKKSELEGKATEWRFLNFCSWNPVANKK